MSTVEGGPPLFDCGLPLRTLFLSLPSGPAEKRLGASPRGCLPVSCACSCLASSSSRRSCSALASSTGLGFRASIAFFTRMISPSLRPSERMVDSVISGRMASSILSRSKDKAYREQSSTSQPALRKNSNQSTDGFFDGCNDCLRISRGMSSDVLRGEDDRCCSRCFAIRRSTYFMSSADIFSDGTSITTPFTL